MSGVAVKAHNPGAQPGAGAGRGVRTDGTGGRADVGNTRAVNAKRGDSNGKERCYLIPDGQGGTIKVRAGRRPNAKTAAALQELFRAAKAHIEAQRGKPIEVTSAEMRLS